MAKPKPSIAVSDARGVRSLHVGGEAIQSAMRLGEPYALALDYTRCMMAFLLFHPEPREALMIGLGGGSLAKFFHRHFRKTSIRVIELDARVLAAAREHFHVPPDGARFRVEIGDGADALYPECCDTLVIDAFEDELHVPKLASAEFYDGAFLALREPGAMVVNFMNDDPQVRPHAAAPRARVRRRGDRAAGALRSEHHRLRAQGSRQNDGMDAAAASRAQNTSSPSSSCRSRAISRACAR